MAPDHTALVERLFGPHEWGYRCPVEGGFIKDDAPFDAAALIEALQAELAGHEEAFEGVVRSKIEAETRLDQMRQNHDAVLRMYSQWRSRAEKAEARALAAEQRGEP